MNNVAEHPIQWLTASPLWDPVEPAAATIRPPALLRFKSDTFMEDLQRCLHTTPRKPRPNLTDIRLDGERDPRHQTVPKLFQPVHGHFHLVAGNLVCRLPGLPDHTVDAARGERTGFVLRQLSPNGHDEYGWVPSPSDPEQPTELSTGRMWKPIDDPQKYDPEEELFSLFPLSYKDDGQKRRLHAGLIPVSSREAFDSAPFLSSTMLLDPSAETQYVIRCVYQRPACGPLHDDVVSDRSAAFTMASFIDFDAPARKVRIPMPTDISPSGLAKFRKGVGFIVSKQLANTINDKLPGLKLLEDSKPDHEDEKTMGEICTFALPIITLCAMIVLYIFLALLNLIFFWKPLLKICIPYPKAK